MQLVWTLLALLGASVMTWLVIEITAIVHMKQAAAEARRLARGPGHVLPKPLPRPVGYPPLDKHAEPAKAGS